MEKKADESWRLKIEPENFCISIPLPRKKMICYH